MRALRPVRPGPDLAVALGLRAAFGLTAALVLTGWLLLACAGASGAAAAQAPETPEAPAGSPVQTSPPAEGPAQPPGPVGPVAPVTLEVDPQAEMAIDWTARLLQVEGGVRIRYGEVYVEAKNLQADLESGELVLEGGVLLRQGEQELRGERLRYNLREGSGEFVAARGTFRSPGVQGEVYVSGRHVSYSAPAGAAGPGTPATVLMQGAQLTTCPLDPKPHYHLEARQLEIYLGDRVVARGVSFWDSGIPLFYWPYMVFSLKPRDQDRIRLPEIGYGQREGLFIKNRFPYLGPGNTYGALLVDYFQRLGPAIGLRQVLYDREGWLTAATAYVLFSRLTGRSDNDWRLEVEQRLPSGGWWPEGTLLAGYQLRAAEPGEPGLDGTGTEGGSSGAEVRRWYGEVDLRLAEAQPEPKGTAAPQGALAGREPPGGLLGRPSGSLTLRFDNQDGAITSRYLRGGLRLRQPIAPGSGWEAGLEATLVDDLKAGSPLESRQQLLGYSAQLSRSGTNGFLRLSAQQAVHPDLLRQYDTGQAPSQAPAWRLVSSLPEVAAGWDRLRLGGLELPIGLTASAARLTEQRGGGSGPGSGAVLEANRGAVELSLRPGSWTPVPWFRLGAGGSVSGMWYSTGDRQAAFRGRLEATLRPASFASLSAQYVDEFDLYEVFGGPIASRTPFAFDLFTPQERVTGQLTLTGAGGAVTASLSGGYDILKARPLDLVGTASFQPVDAEGTGRLRLEVGAGYSLATSRWTYALGRVELNTPAWRLQVGGRYDAGLQRIDRIDLNLSTPLVGDWRAGYAGIWSGQQGAFTRGEAVLSLEQDCRVVAFRYDHVKRTFWVEYSITAFPGARVRAGAGPDQLIFDTEGWQRWLEELQGGQNP